MYLLLKMVVFQPAMLVYQRVVIDLAVTSGFTTPELPWQNQRRQWLQWLLFDPPLSWHRHPHHLDQSLFLVPLIGGRYHIIPQLAVYTTYIPLIYCQLGDYNPRWNLPGWDMGTCFVVTNQWSWPQFLRITCSHPGFLYETHVPTPPQCKYKPLQNTSAKENNLSTKTVGTWTS